MQPLLDMGKFHASSFGGGGPGGVLGKNELPIFFAYGGLFFDAEALKTIKNH